MLDRYEFVFSKPKVGDFVVYSLQNSLVYDGAIGVVFAVDEKRELATVMWMIDSVPKFNVHIFGALIVVEDDEHSEFIRKQRCKGIE